jgi:hypothetical protein
MPAPAATASAPIGTWQPPSSAARKARSARVAAVVGAWSSDASSARIVAFALRTCTAIAPCPAAGSHSGAFRYAPTRSARSRRCSPAAARIAASTSPSSTLRSRVGTLPRSSRTSRSGRAASSCARRRRLDVPTRAPAGSSAIDAARPASDGPSTSASRGSSRSSCATTSSPGGDSVGRSLSEWTQQSTRPASRSSSSSLVNSPLPPMAVSATSSRRSPTVV